MIERNFKVEKFIKEWCELVVEEQQKELDKWATKEMKFDIDKIRLETTNELKEKYERRLKIMEEYGRDYIYEHNKQFVPYEIGDYIFSLMK